MVEFPPDYIVVRQNLPNLQEDSTANERNHRGVHGKDRPIQGSRKPHVGRQERSWMSRQEFRNQFTPEALSPMVVEVLRSPGRPLDTESLKFMQACFDHDFVSLALMNWR